MAKAKAGVTTKLSLNKKRKGVAKKSYGPKDQKPKPYKGQGR
jgi:hypothetical protein